MGQPIILNEKPSHANPGVVRFETNRMLTGTEHERYRAGDEIFGHRPPDELARRLFEQDSVAGVHVHGNMITVELNRGYDSSGLAEVIEYLYRFYPDPDPAAAEAPAEEAPAEEAATEVAAEEAATDEPAEEPVTEEPAAEDESAEAPAEEASVDEA